MIINKPTFVGYDIIGDVHGCASALRRLLTKLGYLEGEQGFVYHDAENPRQVLFLGDIIDRGPEIKDSLNIAKTMCDHGNAQMILGNHEINAIAWYTPFNQGFIRKHDERAYQQLKATLEQFSDQPELLAEYIRWFKTLPLFLEFENFRLVHACWDADLIQTCRQLYTEQPRAEDLLFDAAKGNSFAKAYLERLTQGLNIALPDGRYMLNRQGFKRRSFRAKFWSEQLHTFQDLSFQPESLPEDVADLRLTQQQKSAVFLYDSKQKPLLLGHYWLQGTPQLVSENIACLDYSAVNGGLLVAYQMSCDAKTLSNDNFVFVDAKECR